MALGACAVGTTVLVRQFPGGDGSGAQEPPHPRLDHQLARRRAHAATTGEAATNEFKDYVDKELEAMEAKQALAAKVQRGQLGLLAAGVVFFAAWYAVGIFLASSACQAQ